MRFLENRKSNRPVELTELECRSLFTLIPRLGFAIDDAIRILCKGKLPANLDNLFWYELKESNLATTHSHSIAKLLITLLHSISSLGIWDNYIVEIVKSLQGISEKEKKSLQEEQTRVQSSNRTANQKAAQDYNGNSGGGK